MVSDLEKQRPIWFGGTDRSETSMDEFYRFLGEKKAKRIRLAKSPTLFREDPRRC